MKTTKILKGYGKNMKIYKKDIFVYVTFQGAYALEIRVRDRLHKMQYMGYTLKDAKDMFIKQVRGYYE